jgi:hypothetical protein
MKLKKIKIVWSRIEDYIKILKIAKFESGVLSKAINNITLVNITYPVETEDYIWITKF